MYRNQSKSWFVLWWLFFGKQSDGGSSAGLHSSSSVYTTLSKFYFLSVLIFLPSCVVQPRSRLHLIIVLHEMLFPFSMSNIWSWKAVVSSSCFICTCTISFSWAKPNLCYRVRIHSNTQTCTHWQKSGCNQSDCSIHMQLPKYILMPMQSTLTPTSCNWHCPIYAWLKKLSCTLLMNNSSFHVSTTSAA